MIHQRIISVIGLGYVGLTTAAALSKIGKVVAFDIDAIRIAELKKGHDRNEEVPDSVLKTANIYFTTNSADLKEADFHIITVPTPLDNLKHPDLSILLNASKMVGEQLKKGGIVVYESTVYPGATEEKCVPILEKVSKLIYGKDFTVGFSPERINPSDKEHVFHNIVKIVSGTDKKTVDIIASIYKSVIKAGVFPVSSIRIAEAAKIIENTQRDVNIAFMNDIAIMLHTLGIDTAEVIAAMKTKWNYIHFQPGLVGGHCIGVNTYYLMHKAEEMNYHSDIILAARRINESLVKFIANETIKKLIHINIPVKKARIAIFGLTYKENCGDIRDTKVIDIVKELESYDAHIMIHDPLGDYNVIKNQFNIELTPWDDLKNLDVIIFAVAHKYYINLPKSEILEKLNPQGLIMDIKEIFNPKEFENTGITLWRL